MALIKCPECGTEISDKAARCPHCGAPAEVKAERDTFVFTPPTVEENTGIQAPVVEGSAANSKKKKSNLGRIIIAVLVVAGLGGISLKLAKDYARDTTVSDTDTDTEKLRQQLIDDVNYAEEHIAGVWSDSYEEIVEFNSNGDYVFYRQAPSPINVSDGESVPFNVQYFFQNIEYRICRIVDPNSYSDEELEMQSIARQGTNPVCIIKCSYSDEEEPCYSALEFLDENSFFSAIISGRNPILGADTYKRVENNPKITNIATGLYVNKLGAQMSVAIIQPDNNETGYYQLSDSSGTVEGVCTISDKTIALKIQGMDDFIFERKGSDLIEIGSEELPGSHLTYKKVSNLAYCSPANVISDGEPTIKPEEPPVVPYDPGDQSVIEGSWEPVVYPKIPGDDSAIRIYCEGYEPVDLDIICRYGNVMDDWLTDLVFIASEPVTDFRIVDLEMSEFPSDDDFYSMGETLLDVGELMQGQAITASLSFADIPTWGIIYTGLDGRTRVFSVGDNGGGRGIEELEGYAPGVCLWEDVPLETPIN